MRNTNEIINPNFHSSFNCTNPDHEHYGRDIEVYEMQIRDHFIHIETIDNRCFNVSVDGDYVRNNLTYSGLINYLKEKTR